MRTLNWMFAAATVLLAACGGGIDVPPPAAQPTIASFTAGQAAYRMGERARLTAVFSGGSGRIEPGVGAVQSGVPVTAPVLEGDVTYRLVVEAPGRPAASRTLSVPVSHHDRFIEAGTFASAFHSAVELPDGGVLIVGGSRGASTVSESVDRFDPVTRTFSQVGRMATGRAYARAVVLDDGKVLVAGGITSSASGVTYELVDAAARQVTPAGVPVRNRVGHTATKLLDGRVLIAGGTELPTAEIWDPATRSARPVAARMANPREGHTATLLADGRVLLVGGYTMANAYWLAEVFDPRTETFTPIGTPTVTPNIDNRALHSAHRMADGSVLVLGGELFNPAVDEVGRVSASVLRFDPVTQQLTPLSGLLVPRTFTTAVALADDRVLMFGGIGGDQSFLGAGEVYRPGRPSSPAASLPVARAWHTASRLPGGQVLIVGGVTPTGETASNVLIYQ